MTTITFLRNPKHSQQSGVIYSTDRKMLIHCPKNYSGRLEIPEGTETVGIEAFAGCKALTSVILPQSLQKIEMLAFANCTALSKISISTHQNIAVSVDAFDLILFENCILEVPTGKTLNYNNANIWSEFDCIIEKTRTAEVQYYKNNKSLKQVI